MKTSLFQISVTFFTMIVESWFEIDKGGNILSYKLNLNRARKDQYEESYGSLKDNVPTSFSRPFRWPELQIGKLSATFST